jgi:hypothetical protein
LATRPAILRALAEQADAANQARPQAAACNNSRQVSVSCSELQQAFQQSSLGNEEETLARIREYYEGPVHFAEDLQCFRL